MIFRSIIQIFLRLGGNRQPYIASKGPGRWTIRQWDSIGRRWIDSDQTFFNKHEAKRGLKATRELFKKQAS
jgi:hypothetical protein